MLNTSAGDDREEAFDGIDLGGGLGEMENPARITGQPFQCLGMLVGGVVVDDGWTTLPIGTTRSTVLKNLMNSLQMNSLLGLRVLSRSSPSTPCFGVAHLAVPYRRAAEPARRGASCTGRRSADITMMFARCTCLSGRWSQSVLDNRTRSSGPVKILTVRTMPAESHIGRPM